jgi:potassium efflux system protein
MQRIRTFFLALVSLVVLGPISSPVHGQATESPSAEVSPASGPEDSAPTVNEVQSAIEALDADASLEESIKSALRNKYEQALEALQTAEEFTTRTQELASAIQAGPESVEDLQSELATLESEDPIDLPDNGTAAELQREIDSRQVSVELLRKQLSELAEEATRLQRRPVEIPERLLEVQRELSEIRERLDAPDLAASDASRSVKAERLLLQSREAQLAAEQEMLEEEQLGQSIRLEVLKARQALLEAQIAAGESALEELNRQLQLLVSNMAERIRRVANSVPSELTEGNPSVASLVAEVRALADKLEDAIRQENRLEGLQDELRKSRESLAAEFSSLQEQRELNSNGGALVQLLFELDRRCLAALREIRRNPITGLEDAQLGSLRVREDLRAQSEIEDQLGTELAERLEGLLAARREALEELGRRYMNLTRSLAAADQEREEYRQQAEEIRESIDQTLFGFGLRACPPISVRTFLDLPGAVGWSFQPAHWREAGSGVVAVLQQKPLSSLILLVAVAALLLLRPRLIASLKSTGSRNKRISTDRYRNTWEAAGWTIFLALPLPLLMGFLGWTLAQNPAASDWFAGVRSGFQQAAWVVLVVALMLSVVRPQGLGELHFGWNETKLGPLRRALLLTAAIYVPALIVTTSCTYGDASAYLRSLGRVAFLIAHLWALLQVFRLFFAKSGTGAAENQSRMEKEHEPGRIGYHWLWCGVLFAGLLSIVVMIVLGYVITALIWSLGVVVTLAIIGVGTVLYGFAVRWFALRHRRLAFEEALQRRRSREALVQEDDGPTEIVEVDSEEASEYSLELVGEQTRKLLRSLASLVVLLTVLAFWSQVLSLGDLIGGVTLPMLGGLTLQALLLAILVVVITFVVVKNLPGFLELIIFRSNNVQPGTRLAIYTLCQYVAIALGIVAFADAVQVDWAQFGWIVTALSVGIGFGLQEVVANFVSGLILLLERPIRVGDIVTVESTTGTVKKIHLRATTITNWDRQEFVVPNRTLITNTLLNWTLSAPLNRIVIPVGVAYGSDTEHAREILLEVAKDHPNVLDDPAPMATFEQFADSSLNIYLRAYLPDLDARLSTISQLHTEIHQRFAEAGIEIAFPQQDLHLRSGWKEAFAALT